MFEGIKFLVRLSVSGVLFQKVGPIYDKASWPVLVLRNGHFNFKFIVYSDMKDFIQIIRALFIEILNPIKDGLFQGCLRMGGLFGLPSLKSATQILQWWNLAVIPYLRKFQKMCKSRDTPFGFCWDQHFYWKSANFTTSRNPHIDWFLIHNFNFFKLFLSL